MKLFNIFPVLSSFGNWPSNNRNESGVRMKGIWFGSKGRVEGFLERFIPVVVYEEEPQPNEWGIIASTTGRPKIAANQDTSLGWIALLSSNVGDGRAIGQVLVDQDNMHNVQVISHGVGGALRPFHRYWEYLVKISGPANFLVETRNGNKLWIRFEHPDLEVVTSPMPQAMLEDHQFLLLSDPDVPHWRPAEHAQIERPR